MTAPRKLTPGRLILASHNAGKLREIKDLTDPYQIETISSAALELPEPEETGKTFVANASLKAHDASQRTNAPALADDSGLVVSALDGAPGIYSARWAGAPRDFSAAMARVEDELRNKHTKDYSAYFISVLCLAWPDGHEEVFEGRVNGTLTFPPRGEKGFGYDPIFIPDGFEETFGEMDAALKKTLAHRTRAFELLEEACLKP